MINFNQSSNSSVSTASTSWSSSTGQTSSSQSSDSSAVTLYKFFTDFSLMGSINYDGCCGRHPTSECSLELKSPSGCFFTESINTMADGFNELRGMISEYYSGEGDIIEDCKEIIEDTPKGLQEMAAELKEQSNDFCSYGATALPKAVKQMQIKKKHVTFKPPVSYISYSEQLKTNDSWFKKNDYQIGKEYIEIADKVEKAAKLALEKAHDAFEASRTNVKESRNALTQAKKIAGYDTTQLENDVLAALDQRKNARDHYYRVRTETRDIPTKYTKPLKKEGKQFQRLHTAKLKASTARAQAKKAVSSSERESSNLNRLVTDASRPVQISWNSISRYL